MFVDVVAQLKDTLESQIPLCSRNHAGCASDGGTHRATPLQCFFDYSIHGMRQEICYTWGRTVLYRQQGDFDDVQKIPCSLRRIH